MQCIFTCNIKYNKGWELSHFILFLLALMSFIFVIIILVIFVTYTNLQKFKAVLQNKTKQNAKFNTLRLFQGLWYRHMIIFFENGRIRLRSSLDPSRFFCSDDFWTPNYFPKIIQRKIPFELPFSISYFNFPRTAEDWRVFTKKSRRCFNKTSMQTKR